MTQSRRTRTFGAGVLVGVVIGAGFTAAAARGGPAEAAAGAGAGPGTGAKAKAAATASPAAATPIWAPALPWAVRGDWGDEYWKVNDKLSVNLIFGKDVTGETAAAMEMLSGDAGFAVPEHEHKDSVELLYVLEGHGLLTLAGSERGVGPGTAVYIPKGVKHSFVLTGSTPLLALQIYTPGGPEARFKAPPAKAFKRSAHDETFPDPVPHRTAPRTARAGRR
ncbi:MAG TPA: cupin domain-containing protein [Myxococcota bacterium]|jgi:quercetin dioxygenase-like cupin family protein|nr:cupin domain-containing protein [Myxococcota bacterium]